MGRLENILVCVENRSKAVGSQFDRAPSPREAKSGRRREGLGDSHFADRGHRQLLVRLLHGKKIGDIAEVIQDAFDVRGPGFHDQPRSQARLPIEVARREMHFVVANRHRFAVVGKNRGVRDLVSITESTLSTCASPEAFPRLTDGANFGHLPRRSGMHKILVRDAVRQVAKLQRQSADQAIEMSAHAVAIGHFQGFNVG